MTRARNDKAANEKKHCLVAGKPERIPPLCLQGKERREITTTMKYLAIIALAALAIGLDACSSSTPPSTTSTTASTGYKK